MGVRQISVFLENKAGRLSDVTKVLGDNNVDISALSIADTTHFGILRLIVNNPELAENVLKENGYTVSTSYVIAIAIDDNPGALAKALEVLTDNDITIEYIYAFTGKTESKALVVLKVEDIERSTDLLKEKNIKVLKDSEVYSL